MIPVLLMMLFLMLLMMLLLIIINGLPDGRQSRRILTSLPLALLFLITTTHTLPDSSSLSYLNDGLCRRQTTPHLGSTLLSILTRIHLLLSVTGIIRIGIGVRIRGG